MCILEENVSLDEILGYYMKRIDCEKKNINRIKKFYHDEETFNDLMNRIIEKDAKRIFKFLHNKVETPNIENNLPNPWRIFYIILDIVQNEGEIVPPFDKLTSMFPSRTIIYMGWTFSWVHGENTVISIYNKEDELVYRF